MAEAGDLANKGFILNRLTAERGRTVIVTGLHRSGTSLDALRARPDSLIRVRVARHGVELDNSGKRLCDFGSAA